MYPGIDTERANVARISACSSTASTFLSPAWSSFPCGARTGPRHSRTSPNVPGTMPGSAASREPALSGGNPRARQEGATGVRHDQWQ